MLSLSLRTQVNTIGTNVWYNTTVAWWLRWSTYLWCQFLIKHIIAPFISLEGGINHTGELKKQNKWQLGKQKRAHYLENLLVICVTWNTIQTKVSSISIKVHEGPKSHGFSHFFMIFRQQGSIQKDLGKMTERQGNKYITTITTNNNIGGSTYPAKAVQTPVKQTSIIEMNTVCLSLILMEQSGSIVAQIKIQL